MSSEPIREDGSTGLESSTANSSFARWRKQIVEIGFRPLPLQDETSMFILVNVLDIYATHMLLSMGGSEVNPLARLFLDNWGFDGMIFFKMGIITFFCVVTQLIGQYNIARATRLMRLGTITVALVVIYASGLLISQSL